MVVQDVSMIPRGLFEPRNRTALWGGRFMVLAREMWLSVQVLLRRGTNRVALSGVVFSQV